MNWSVQFLVAAGTIGAVLAALFGKWFAGKVFPPKLHVWLHDPDGNRIRTDIVQNGEARSFDSRWYHLRVENQQRLSPATQVNINLLRIEEPDASGQPVMVWTGEIPLRWRHQQIRQLSPTVGPAIDADLFCVIRDASLQLQPMIAPNDMTHQFAGACKMYVTVQATSVEGESNLLRLEIAWDGGWAEDKEQMRRHLVYREVPASAT